MLLIALLGIAAVYAIVMFSVYGAQRRRHRKTLDEIEASAEEPGVAEAEHITPPSGNAEKRLQQLKEHLDSGLITKEEYKARRSDIVKG